MFACDEDRTGRRSLCVDDGMTGVSLAPDDWPCPAALATRAAVDYCGTPAVDVGPDCSAEMKPTSAASC